MMTNLVVWAAAGSLAFWHAVQPHQLKEPDPVEFVSAMGAPGAAYEHRQHRNARPLPERCHTRRGAEISVSLACAKDAG